MLSNSIENILYVSLKVSPYLFRHQIKIVWINHGTRGFVHLPVIGQNMNYQNDKVVVETDIFH